MNCNDLKRISEKLEKKNICYVLITCTESTEDGDMEVEMTYEGDASLACYLLQGAQHFIEEQEDSHAGISAQTKVLSLHG